MVNKTVLKEIILSNENFIVNKIQNLINRNDINFPSGIKKVIVFYGVRRSGKTFILYDIFKKNNDVSLYIDFEDERLVNFEIEDFEILKQIFFELKPHLVEKDCIFLFDEIQNVAGWEKFCRRIVEKEGIMVFVTGSSSKMMPFEIHTELRGRVWSSEVMPFSFTEYLKTKHIDPVDNTNYYTKKKAILKNFFKEYCTWGGFPEVVIAHNDFERSKILKEYLNAMFFRDLTERYNIKNLTLLEALSDKLFSSFSTKMSLSSFYKQYKDKFPFSKDMLFKYYKYFLNSMLVFEVRKLVESSYKRLRNPAKIYLIDIGLARKTTSSDVGRILENLVFLYYKRKGYEIYYFHGTNECDFIIKKDNGSFLPIQVCYDLTEQNMPRELTGLIEASKSVKSNEGLIITYDDEREMIVDGIHISIIPAWKFFFD